MLRKYLWRSLILAIVALLLACLPQPDQSQSLTPKQAEALLNRQEVIQYDPAAPSDNARYTLEDMAG